MHNTTQRANSLFTLLMSSCFYLFCIGLFASYPSQFSSQLHSTIDPTLSAKVETFKIGYGRLPSQYYDFHIPRSSAAEYILLNFSLNADLRPAFQWNTKQLFVYVTLEYETANFKRNVISIWDKIVTEEKQALIKLEKKRNKYAVTHRTNKIVGVKARLVLHWSVTQIAGAVVDQQSRVLDTVEFVKELE